MITTYKEMNEKIVCLLRMGDASTDLYAAARIEELEAEVERLQNLDKEGQGMEDFKKELEQLLNKHSIENGSNTPDFILACYLIGCLEAYNHALTHRDRWYGIEPKPLTVGLVKEGDST